MGSCVLVTGGAGFIGSHLVEALCARGDQVVCLDNFDDYYDPALKRIYLEEIEEHEHFRLIEGDIRDRTLLLRLGDTYSFDAIIHLAARAGVRPSIEQPELYADVNLAGTSNVLELARKFDIKKFVFASSSSVYGERTQVPFREVDPVDHPVSPYAATKKGGELLCHTYHYLHDIDVACLRFFTVYGPRQRPEMAIHKFTRMIHKGDPVPMYGDGSARRDYTYVHDIVQGIVRALDDNRGYNIYNLGNHQMVTLWETIHRIGEALEIQPQILSLPQQPGDVSTTCADIRFAQETLGYDPATRFEDGILHFVNWYTSVMVT